MCDKQNAEDKENELKQKEYYDNRVAFFASWVNAWIQNRMELDKQLLTLSALAIGLLVGIFGQPETVTQLFLWLLAGLSFLICGGLVLVIFQLNTSYIEILLEDHHTPDEAKQKIIISQKEKEKTRQLSKLTKWSFILFLIGIFLTLVLSINQSGFTITKGA